MKPINNFDNVQGYTSTTQLPVGGYVLKITGVRYEEGQNGNSDRIVVAFDVAEGMYAGFFRKKYESDLSEDTKWKGTTILYVPKEDGSDKDNWTLRKFKTFTNALEDSNKDYKWDWDENKWKGLLIGGVFGEFHTIINGRQVQYNAFSSAYSADDIRKNNFKLPQPKYKNGAGKAAPAPAANQNLDDNGFLVIETDDWEGVPF